MAKLYQKELAAEVVYDWAETTEKMIGGMMRKKNVKFSDNSKQNIVIKLIHKSSGLISLHFFYRDALRFTDMGAGRGYTKGQRITKGTYRDIIDETQSPRKRKRILNKPIYSRLNRLMDVVAVTLIKEAEDSLQNILD
jgi:hypothetical protein